METNSMDWEQRWQKTLSGLPTRIWCTGAHGLFRGYDLVPGARQFIASLKSCRVAVVIIPGCSESDVPALVERHSLPVAFMDLGADGDADFCMDPGLFLDAARAWGHEIVGYSGDSGIDIRCAQVAAGHGGLVVTATGSELSGWCDEGLMPEQWRQCGSLEEALGIRELQQRIGGN